MSISQLILFTRTMVSRITGAADFPTPPSSPYALADVSTAADDLETAAQDALNGGVHETAVMYEKREVVENMLNVYVRYVEDVANDPTNIGRGADIITEAGFSVKRSGSRQPFVFAVKNAEFTGAVLLTAPVVKRASHEWQYTTTPDDVGSWTSAPDTLQAHTFIADLTPGVQTYFRHRVLTSEGFSPWDDPISITVH